MSEHSNILSWAWIVISLLVQPIFLFTVWRTWRDAGGWRALRSYVAKEIVRSTRKNEAAARADAEVRELVETAFRRRQVALARAVMSATWVALCIYHMVRLADEVTPTAGSHQNDLSYKDSVGRRIMAIVTLVLLTPVSLFPKTLASPRSLPYWMWGSTALTIFVLLGSPTFGADARSLFVSWPILGMWALASGGLYLHLPSLALSSVCISISVVLSFAQVDMRILGDGTSLNSIMRFEGLSLAWRLAIYAWAHTTLKDSARQEVDASLGKCQGSAVSALLDLVCDAVADLDHNFTLKENSVKLAGLLMRDIGRSLGGSAFADFIAPGEDAARFQQVVGGASAGDGGQSVGDGYQSTERPPNMLSVRLRDATGHFFSVVIYHMPYLSITGQLHHLVGLQECQADDALRPGRNTTMGVGPATNAQRTLPAARLRPDIAQALDQRLVSPPVATDVSDTVDDWTVSSGSASSQEGCLCVSPLGGTAGGAAGSLVRGDDVSGCGHPGLGTLTVLAAERLPIISGTDKLLTRLGVRPEGHACFADVIAGKDIDRILARLLAIAGSVRRGEIEPHTGKFGEWKVSAVGGFKRCILVVDFHRPQGDGGQHLIDIRLSDARREGWRTRRGPLRIGQDTSGGSVCTVVGEHGSSGNLGLSIPSVKL